MNRKIYRAVVIVLVVLTIGQIIRFGFQLYGDQYHYHYDEDTFLYSIQDGQYSELPEKKIRNEMEHVKADAQMLECYAVADYYEAASLYYAYENIGNAAKAAIAKSDMEEAEGRMGDLSYCAEEIDGYFVKYFASSDSESQSTDVEGQSTEAE